MCFSIAPAEHKAMLLEKFEKKFKEQSVNEKFGFARKWRLT
jgi:hypothetical protein